MLESMHLVKRKEFARADDSRKERGLRYRKTSNERFTASKALITDICLAGAVGGIEKHLSGKQNGKENGDEEGMGSGGKSSEEIVRKR